MQQAAAIPCPTSQACIGTRTEHTCCVAILTYALAWYLPCSYSTLSNKEQRDYIQQEQNRYSTNRYEQMLKNRLNHTIPFSSRGEQHGTGNLRQAESNTQVHSHMRSAQAAQESDQDSIRYPHL